MIAEIKCPVCDEHIGTLEKEDITEQDILEHQKMVTCSNGHTYQEEENQ
jgi:hypothetical protein